MALNRSSLSEQIYDQLREDILLGQIPAGQKLGLKELQEKFQVSSTAVREALIRLSQEQLVTYTTNQGATVITLDEEDVKHLLDLCRVYDCYAVEALCRNADRDSIVLQLQDAIQKQREFVKAEHAGLKEYGDILGCFHEIIYRATNNPWMISHAIQCNRLLYLADVRTGTHKYPKSSIEEHQGILDAIQAGDCDKAIELAGLHRDQERNR